MLQLTANLQAFRPKEVMTPTPPNRAIDYDLKLRAGEVVRVRCEEEILSTLDCNGCLQGMPFMPEMLQYCGKEFRVFKRAHKTCDTIHSSGGRKLESAVHLEGVRCDGSAHDGCQALCLIFWKEAWVERVQPDTRHKVRGALGRWLQAAKPFQAGNTPIGRSTLFEHARADDPSLAPGEQIYSCQTTKLLEFTKPLPWWDLRQYVSDVLSGNISFADFVTAFLFAFVRRGLTFRGYRAQLWIYDSVQKWMGRSAFPFREGHLKKTPTEKLDLQPGELVQVKTNQEILATLDTHSKNRGLFFDYEEAAYCGGTYKVLQRVERMINEKTGRMTALPGECLMLDGAICRGLYNDRRIFCPRSVYCYWREIWLRRIE